MHNQMMMVAWTSAESPPAHSSTRKSGAWARRRLLRCSSVDPRQDYTLATRLALYPVPVAGRASPLTARVPLTAQCAWCSRCGWLRVAARAGAHRLRASLPPLPIELACHWLSETGGRRHCPFRSVAPNFFVCSTGRLQVMKRPRSHGLLRRYSNLHYNLAVARDDGTAGHCRWGKTVGDPHALSSTQHPQYRNVLPGYECDSRVLYGPSPHTTTVLPGRTPAVWAVGNVSASVASSWWDDRMSRLPLDKGHAEREPCPIPQPYSRRRPTRSNTRPQDDGRLATTSPRAGPAGCSWAGSHWPRRRSIERPRRTPDLPV